MPKPNGPERAPGIHKVGDGRYRVQPLLDADVAEALAANHDTTGEPPAAAVRRIVTPAVRAGGLGGDLEGE